MADARASHLSAHVPEAIDHKARGEHSDERRTYVQKRCELERP